MTKLKQVKPEAVDAILKDEDMIKFIQEKDEPIFEVVNPQEYDNSHPLLGVEVALRGCELSGVFTKPKEK